jgi:membrane protease YdiL (CAAX protease family)
MNLIPASREENSPYYQLLIIAGYALIGLIIGTILSFGVLLLLYGTSIFSNAAALSGGDPAFAAGLQIAQLLTTVFTFIVPSILFAATEKTKLSRFYNFRKPTAALFFIVFIFMICSIPVMEWIALINQKMELPGFLKPVEAWMREKEDAAMKMTYLLLRIRNVWDFLLDLGLIALLPGIAEELLFRGALQRSFYRMYKNPHVAIWVSAFIFSAIHVQFFGFFPRMIITFRWNSQIILQIFHGMVMLLV